MSDPAQDQLQMEGEEGAADDIIEDDEMDMDGDEKAEGADYVKKDFVARPYQSPYETEEDVKKLNPQNSRTLIRMRVTKERREFCNDTIAIQPRDAPETTNDLRQTQNKGNQYPNKDRKVLEIGLQAANQMKTFSSQTYFNRMVNASCQYNANDFFDELKRQTNNETNLNGKLEKFIDRVSYAVESALSSNEIINVFQDDFDMLGDEDAAVGSQSSTVNLRSRNYFYNKDMRVSCIKFHPTKPHFLAFSVVKNLSFNERAEIMGTSFDAHVLILDFSDSQLINLAYDLVSPVEVTSIEFHPEHEKIIMGGCINGQVITWDLASHEHRLTGGKKAESKSEDDDEDNAQQSAITMKSLIMSQIEKSHKSYVADLVFVPGSVKVDRKNDNKGKSEHFLSCSEDGYVSIWDSRHVRKDVLKEAEVKKKQQIIWIPYLSIQLFRLDGSPDLGISRLLVEPDQVTTTFWAGSFEGELLFIDWSAKPAGKGGAQGGAGGPAAGAPGGEGEQMAEHVKISYDTERNQRPVLMVERSPFYDDLIMTVHDFCFAIWKVSLGPDNETPIFRSANTFGSHNTCGAFSPTRPGVIFITKTDAIDVWDFYDQSNKPSLVLNIATSAITYFKFQYLKKKEKRQAQYMAYGDENEGTCYLFEVPSNLSKPQENEEEQILKFWNRELEKCEYVKARKEVLRTELEEKQKAEAIRKAKEEAQKDSLGTAEQEAIDRDNEAYLDLFWMTQAKLGLIDDEKLDQVMKARGKKK